VCHRHVVHPIRPNLIYSGTTRAVRAQTVVHRPSHRDASHGDAFISLPDCSGICDFIRRSISLICIWVMHILLAYIQVMHTYAVENMS